MLHLLLLFCCLLGVAHCQIRHHFPPIQLPITPLNTSCPLHRDDDALRELARKTLAANPYPSCPCGAGKGSWTRAVHLDMSDSNQQCPSNWTLITTPVRGCGRATNSVTYPVNNFTYSHVCGKILAYQRGYMSGFFSNIRLSSRNILEDAYLLGVSLTYGPPGSRQHIWSFVGGMYELDDSMYDHYKCPCSVINWRYEVPAFINNDYFCDSGNPGPNINSRTFYTENPLWDGQGCGLTSTCCEFNSPSWFCTSLLQPTNESLEIKNCFHSSSVEDSIIRLIDIYIK